MEPLSRSSFFESNKGFAVFLVWVLACVSFYFFKIPPHPIQSFRSVFLSFQSSSWTWPQVFRTWLDHGLFLMFFVGTLIVFVGTGNRSLNLVGPWIITPVEEWVWSLALGFVFWGTLAEGLAFQKIFYPSLMRGLILSALLIFLLWDKKEAFVRCWPFQELIDLPLLWMGAAGLILLFSFSNLLAPEMSWDAMTYQLILPKFYFLNHGFYPVTGIVPSHYPSLGQMFFSWGLLWGNDSLARSFCFLAHMGTALALVGLGTRLENSKVGWLAAAFYWIFPYLNIFSTRGYVDLFAGFYEVLGLGSFTLLLTDPRQGIKIVEKSDLRVFEFLGFLALGAIWGIKYNAVAFWLAGVALLGWTVFKKEKGPVVWIGMVAAPIFFLGPWALKDWVYTHNPVYPYLSKVFQTFDWSDFDQRASAIKFQVEGWRGFLKLPMMLWGIFFKNYSGAPNEEISLIPLILLPLLGLAGRRLNWKAPLLTAILIPFFFWLVTSHQLRLISAVIALASLFWAAGYERARSHWVVYAKSLNLLLGFCFLVTAIYLFQGLVQQPNPFANFLGFQSRSDFLSLILVPKGCVSIAGDLNRRLPEDAKVLILGQQNGYYLERSSVYDFDYTMPVLKKLTEKAATPQKLYAQFKENGFTHILYNANSMMGTALRANGLGVDRYPWKSAELTNYEQFFLKFTRKLPLPIADGYSLYEIVPREGFSTLPEYLPGTEFYYLKNMKEAMGFSKMSDIVGKSIPLEVYLKSYEGVSDQQLELGYPCFQWAFAELSGRPESIRGALRKGGEGFRRNGDKASWLTLQGDSFLVQKKTARAIPLLEEAEGLSPEREDVARNLAVAYYNEHDLKRAALEADRAAALAPFSEEYQQLARQLKAAVSSEVR